MRTCGVLLPISSLPSRYGIGTFSKEAYRFVDQMREAGQTYWQILPLGPTGYGDSPYQAFSTFAGNPYFIDLEELVEDGLLTTQECEACDFGGSEHYVDYEKMYDARFPLLRKAYERSNIREKKEYQEFCRENQDWLEGYCMYMAVKNHFDGQGWNEWPEAIRDREPEAMAKYREELADEISFYGFMQYYFLKQWKALKEYANDKGLKLIGDIPIYVAFDSADTWAAPELFQFDEEHLPIGVAGCPPDGFSPTGQLWGNPLYDWKYHKKTGYAWWIKRIEHCFKLYDMIRVDHFRGFDEYWAIPYGDETAERGKWEKGPGLELFTTLKEELGELPMIAEDLGFLTPSVLKMVEDTGYPGMKVLEFAFDASGQSTYLPHNYPQNCVVYTGTHDNQTLKAWYEDMAPWDKDFTMEYLNLYGKNASQIQWEFIRVAMMCSADTAIIPMQDYLELGREARVNEPSTLGLNWKWRLGKDDLKSDLLAKMRRQAWLYGRLH